MLKSNNKKSNMQKSIGKKATFKKSNSTIWTVFTKTRCVTKYSRNAGVNPSGTANKIVSFLTKTNQNILGNRICPCTKTICLAMVIAHVHCVFCGYQIHTQWYWKDIYLVLMHKGVQENSAQLKRLFSIVRIGIFGKFSHH